MNLQLCCMESVFCDQRVAANAPHLRTMHACCGRMLWMLHVHEMVLTAAGGAVEPCCATAVSLRMTTGVSVRACFGSHGAAVAGQRTTTAGQLQQLRGVQQLEVDCDRGCVRRLRASSGSSTAAPKAWWPEAAVRLLRRRREGQQRQSSCCRGGACDSSTPPIAAALVRGEVFPVSQ